MIKQSISDRYKVDPYGTEEIISSAANSCAPILTIDYGDEVQTDAEFTIRPTKGSLDTNISDVAIVGPIKGNTVSWNQLYDNIVPTVVSGHKYFIREKNGNTVAKSISTTISYTADSTERNCVDLTLIYNAGNEPSTPEAFEADYYKWFGKQLTCEPYSAGELRHVKMSYLKSVGFNQWDGEFDTDKLYDWNNQGNKKTVSGWICTKNLIRVISGKNYCVKSKSGVQVQCCAFDNNGAFVNMSSEWGTPGRILPASPGVFTIPSGVCYIGLSFHTTYNDSFCVNVSYPSIKDGSYEPYWKSVLSIPATTLTGRLNGQGNSVVVFPDGMKKAGSVYDEIIVDNNVVKAIKRIGTLDLGTLTYSRDSSRDIYTVCAPIQGVKYGSSAWDITLECAKYVAKKESNSDKTISIFKLNSRVYIADSGHSTLPTSQDNWLDGVMMNYVLENLEEYILDDASVQKVMLGNTEVTKVYLGSDVIFQSQS